MKRATETMSKFQRFLSDPSERRKLAKSLAAQIRSASSLAKITRNRQSRATAYQRKVQLIETALERFKEYFSVISFEQDEHLGNVLLIALPDGAVHCPLAAMARDREIVDLSKLPYRVTLKRQIKQRTNEKQLRGVARPAFA